MLVDNYLSAVGKYKKNPATRGGSLADVAII